MRTTLLAGACAALLAGPAPAVVIDFVPIAAAGNACDVQPQGCFGAVPYDYAIGKHEVTNAQYAEFLNAVAETDATGLYNPDMSFVPDDKSGGIERTGSPGSYSYAVSPGRENHPVVFVSWYDTLRFANWLHNGQPTSGIQDASTTEDGAYTFAGATSVGPRNPGALFFLASEDEWYKAAYYDAAAAAYKTHVFAADPPFGEFSTECVDPPGTVPYSMNCAGGLRGTTEVGAYTTSPSASGTFGQGGNVSEWNEATGGVGRIIRGAFWISTKDPMYPYVRFSGDPAAETGPFAAANGFRVATVPEPGAGLLLMAGLLALAGRRRGRG